MDFASFNVCLKPWIKTAHTRPTPECLARNHFLWPRFSHSMRASLVLLKVPRPCPKRILGNSAIPWQGKTPESHFIVVFISVGSPAMSGDTATIFFPLLIKHFASACVNVLALRYIPYQKRCYKELTFQLILQVCTKRKDRVSNRTQIDHPVVYLEYLAWWSRLGGIKKRKLNNFGYSIHGSISLILIFNSNHCTSQAVKVWTKSRSSVHF